MPETSLLGFENKRIQIAPDYYKHSCWGQKDKIKTHTQKQRRDICSNILLKYIAIWIKRFVSVYNLIFADFFLFQKAVMLSLIAEVHMSLSALWIIPYQVV